MISMELKNDFREMIFGTFATAFEDLIYSWEKKHLFPEMSGNHFFQENAPQPPNFGLFQQVFDNLKLNNLAKEARR